MERERDGAPGEARGLRELAEGACEEGVMERVKELIGVTRAAGMRKELGR